MTDPTPPNPGALRLERTFNAPAQAVFDAWTSVVGGEEFGGSGEYIEITPPERLVFTWTWDGHEGHEGTQLVEVEFREREDGTTTVVLGA